MTFPTGATTRGPGKAPSWRLTDQDLYLFNEGTHRRLAARMGAHPMAVGQERATAFAVWAPSARAVSVVGDFNGWDPSAHPMEPRASSGVWEAVVPGAAVGHVYKYAITTAGGARVEKADPFAFHSEVPPRTGSVVWDLAYDWGDTEWMQRRGARAALGAPVSIYEVHLGSWRRSPRRPGEVLGYRELAPLLVRHVLDMGFTHVELLPVMEHPFYGSWGYQTTGYFAPTSRYGKPQEFMFLIDELHQASIGVILDWVPSHFATDAFALGKFDGTHLYEHADPRQGIHPDWDSYIFNYGRNEVRSFLASSAEHWLATYHADALRVDAVASMLYLDYSRQAGEWVPNRFGGRENLEAIDFIRQLNVGIYADHPDVQTIAEESTAWAGVSRPTDVGGLGFGYKWDMGWMHDTLVYLHRDPVHRRYHHDQLTFRGLYAFTENFILPLSHDEVVHGKGSLLSQMPGDDWQKFANLRLLYGYQYAQPGKKLLFMGAEIGQWGEWSHEHSLDWALLGYERHASLCRWLADLNRVYRAEPALHELDADPLGFAWVQAGDGPGSTLSFLRRSKDGETVLVVCNFTPVPRHNLRLGVPEAGYWRELVNSDASEYGGGGMGNLGGVMAEAVPHDGFAGTVKLTSPPLAIVMLKHMEA
ncbi:MAG TPA: 1,4-alpha-glucan branching protein GlgB [Acidimicrobiales bacterium]|nr:1,4-alpha-glucan branching protein GlgB [Acidimicrobiales bacterium]